MPAADLEVLSSSRDKAQGAAVRASGDLGPIRGKQGKKQDPREALAALVGTVLIHNRGQVYYLQTGQRAGCKEQFQEDLAGSSSDNEKP